MTYKARRTRDLQGEVKAGTGISVTVSVKPDGTKEYTIINGDPASAITVDGTGLSLIANILRNTMAARMGWSDTNGSIDYRDYNNEPVLQIDPLEKIFLGDANLGSSFFLKQLALGANKLISGDVQIAEDESSTEGVSLQTLADMSNSAAMKAFGMGMMIYDNSVYGYMNGISDEIDELPTTGSYYVDSDEVYSLGGSDYSGVTFVKSGLYRITLNALLKLDSTTNVSEILYIIMIVDANGSPKENRMSSALVTALGGGEYAFAINANIYINAEANDSITFQIESNNTDISDIYVYYTDPLFTLQKIR